MTPMEVLAQLNPHLRTLGIAVPSKIGDSRGVAAMELFTARRFDLAAKHLYARHRLLGVEDGWARRVYEAHLEAFNGFVEADGSGKTGPAAFGAAFDAILDSVVEKGFDASESLVPLGRNGIIIDGAHRLAACLLHRQAVQIVELDHAGSAFDHRFFRERGLAEPFSDAIALEYCRLQPNAVQVLLFPSAKGQVARVRAIVEEYGYIAYEKEVELNRLGAVNLVRQIYESEPWLGSWEDGFSGARRKAEACFSRRGPLRLFVLEASDGADLRPAKGRIRELFGVGNDSVHINDSHEETVRIAQLLLNANSVHHLNRARLQHCPRFWSYLEEFRKWIRQQGHDPEEVSIDGSGVLAAYGLRDARDLDFLHHRPGQAETGIADLSSHNGDVHHHRVSRDALIWNPEHQFYYMGLKFVALPTLRRMKAFRAEGKDYADVRLMGKSIGARVSWSSFADPARATMRIARRRSNDVVIGRGRRLARRVAALFGLEIRRAGSPGTEPPSHELLLPEHGIPDLNQLTAAARGIPSMLSPGAAQQLYTLCYVQDVPGDVVEVGSWQGFSTFFLAAAVRDSGNGALFAIDHFRGNAGKEPLYRVGHDDLHDLRGNFERNLVDRGVWDHVHLLDMADEEARQHLNGRRIRFLFVDGDHTAEGVQRDIDLFFPLLGPGSIVVFDDFRAEAEGLVSTLGDLLSQHTFRRVFANHDALVVVL